MDSYDPETSRPSADWLQLDEGERIELYELMQESSDATGDAYRRYLERLQKLTAKNWRAGS